MDPTCKARCPFYQIYAIYLLYALEVLCPCLAGNPMEFSFRLVVKIPVMVTCHFPNQYYSSDQNRKLYCFYFPLLLVPRLHLFQSQPRFPFKFCFDAPHNVVKLLP